MLVLQRLVLVRSLAVVQLLAEVPVPVRLLLQVVHQASLLVRAAESRLLLVALVVLVFLLQLPAQLGFGHQHCRHWCW